MTIPKRATLRELREALGLTQQDVARNMGALQNYISRIEREGRDLHISAVNEYIFLGLDAKLEITAVVGGKRVALDVIHVD